LAENVPVKESLSNKNLKTSSLERSLRLPNVNKSPVKSPCEISPTELNTSTPRYASLIHIVKNIDFRVTPDRVSKTRNSIKKQRDKVVISDDTSKIGKKVQTVSFNLIFLYSTFCFLSLSLFLFFSFFMQFNKY